MTLRGKLAMIGAALGIITGIIGYMAANYQTYLNNKYWSYNRPDNYMTPVFWIMLAVTVAVLLGAWLVESKKND